MTAAATLLAPPDPDRRPYRRAAPDQRRDDLIAATLGLIAEQGPTAATVRAIAARAGVTAGLIRHYFTSKEDLIRTAYQSLMQAMTDETAMAAAGPGPNAPPHARLTALVKAALAPPVADAARVAAWAACLHMTRADPAMAAIHQANYLAFRAVIAREIAPLPGMTPARIRALSIAINALIDGLWLEGSLLPHAFATGELAEIGTDALFAILCPPTTAE